MSCGQKKQAFTHSCWSLKTLGGKELGTVKTSRVVAIILAVSIAISAVMAYMQLSAFFLSAFLAPALTAAYYQRKHGLRFEKSQRKSISLWYVGISTTIGVVPLALLVNETKDQLNEPLTQVLLALVFGVFVLALFAYFLVYWLMGMDFGAKNVRS